MLLATDAELIEEFSGTPPAEGPAEAECLSPSDLALWGALGGGDRLWRCGGGLPPEVGGWHRVLLVREAPRSQFDALRDLLTGGFVPPGPVASLALTGRGFHGHRDRSWEAVSGNLHLCAVFGPRGVPARHGLQFVMLPAVAVVDALRGAEAGLSPGIKWVNDILLGERKVAGVLAATQSQADRLSAAVLGIGLNVESTPEVAPTPFVPGVISLREAAGDRAPGLARAAHLLLDALLGRYREFVERGPEPLLAAYRRDSMILGQEVRVYPEGLDEAADPETWPPPIAHGVVEEIAPDLTLRIANHAPPVDRGRLLVPDPIPPPKRA